MAVPGWLERAASTASGVRNSSTPTRVSSSRIGINMISGYIGITFLTSRVLLDCTVPIACMCRFRRPDLYGLDASHQPGDSRFGPMYYRLCCVTTDRERTFVTTEYRLGLCILTEKNELPGSHPPRTAHTAESWRGGGILCGAYNETEV